MIVDGKGNMFEDRRKKDRRSDQENSARKTERRSSDRRKAKPQIPDIKKKK